jgi:hypothetical protein
LVESLLVHPLKLLQLVILLKINSEFFLPVVVEPGCPSTFA